MTTPAKATTAIPPVLEPNTKTDGPRTDEGAIPPQAQANVPAIAVTNMAFGSPDFMNVIPSSMKPHLHYRWVRSRRDENHIRVQRARMAGYDFVKRGEVQTLVESDDRGDGKIYIADCVLMSCPKELHQKRRREQTARQQAILASTTAQTEQKARELGVKLIKDD